MKRELIAAFILGAIIISSCEHKPVETNIKKASLLSVNKSKEVDRLEKLSPEEFFQKAYKSNQMEVEFGQMAQQKASNMEVKNFAQKMVEDHSKANDDLMSLAEDKNIQLPDEQSMGMAEKEKRRQLENKSGSKFDRAYMDMMIKEHNKDIELYQMSMKDINDQAINRYAMNTVEIIKSHLEEANSIKQMLEQSAKASSK